MSEQSVERPRASRRRARKRLNLVGIFGEVFITAGVLILLFLGWQLWFNDIVFGNSQRNSAEELSSQWEEDFEASVEPGDEETPTAADPGEPVVMAAVAENAKFANLIIPRLGADYKRPVAEGVGNSVLNNATLGTGHYASSAMPGGMGNFALASHRTAYGGSFHNIHQLVVGDSIYVETEDGWYKYIFRGLEYVKPSGVGVILPVPQQPGVEATERLITLTTCNPFLSSAERIIAYGVFDSWYPRAGGAPSEISAVATAAAGR